METKKLVDVSNGPKRMKFREEVQRVLVHKKRKLHFTGTLSQNQLNYGSLFKYLMISWKMDARLF